MVTEAELLTAVDAAFEITGRGLVSWPAPYPDRPLLAEEYSRVTLVGEAEAVLVINTVRTLLTYLEGKQRETDRSPSLASDAAEPF